MQKSLVFLKGCAELYRNSYSLGAQDYTIEVINRQCDGKRLRRFRSRARHFGLEIHRVDAVNCANPFFDYTPFREQIADTFYGKKSYLRGAVGCFLSHLEAWRTVAAGDQPGGLVCEDDAGILGPLPRKWADFQVPDDADLVFVNARMATCVAGAEQKVKGDRHFGFTPVWNALDARLARKPLISGPGGDGYLLTRKGATALLACFEETNLSMELDWFLVFHSLNAQQRRVFLQRDNSGRFDALQFAERQVIGYVMNPALVEQISMGTTIGFDNPANYVDHDEIFGSSSRCA